jgi:hypothetical protein
MSRGHLTDEEIQLYALDSAACEAATGDHVQSCKDCREKVAGYRLLVTGIMQQPQPSFDFNLSEAVLSRLPASVSRQKEKAFNPVYLLIIGAVLLIAVTISLFNRYVPGLIEGILPLLLYLIVPSVIIMLVILIIDMHKSYRKKMTSLDFY